MLLKWIAVVGLGAVGLTACQASSRVQVDAVTASGVIRCANGQSFINEYGVDSDPSAFGAGTEARRDLYCTNEDGGSLWWDRLDARVRKFLGSYLCDESPIYYTSSNRTVTANRSTVCAAGVASNVWAMGVHGATRPGASSPIREESATPYVTTK